MADLIYEAPPVCAEFMKSEAFGRIIAGPIGSGKTTSCIIELLRRAYNQEKAPDGYRYTRFAVVRQTLKQLKDTVLKDCDTWLATNNLGSWKISEGVYHVQFDDVRSEWVFIPLEDAADQARLLSMQLTGAWLSECVEMKIDILGPVSGRIGRYPAGAKGSPTWAGIIADTNMPVEMSDWQRFMEDLPTGWAKWVQPSGVAPNAENLNFLTQSAETMRLPINHPARIAQGRLYYQRLIDMYGEKSSWVKRYVYAQYGDDPSGQGVFADTFIPSFHIQDQTFIVPGAPLLIGQDFGRNPWSVICQVDPLGRLLMHQEIPAFNTGLEKHVNQSLRAALMHPAYLGLRYIVIGDPSGVNKESVSEESPFDALTRLGIPWQKAPTNDLDPRLRAVETILGRQVAGGPAFIVSRAGCPLLARALSGGYRYKAHKEGALKPVPEKNDKEGYSHPVDCVQYVCLIVVGNLTQYVYSKLLPPPPMQRPMHPGGWT